MRPIILPEYSPPPLALPSPRSPEHHPTPPLPTTQFPTSTSRPRFAGVGAVPPLDLSVPFPSPLWETTP
ncbi:hypothetical protein M427DRAFT_61501 [Gonapodya prolifera JEL478]|uniref:Uncharacterized protein n=1 Tax=Gonapodya prolifera (strain JEL478) TaxID=1344416 RepID=A0A139A297_GONPJ|nr:hypothetical protein M427DRAFT_61501 [Gonapodya prolifera JEL478]|eukprot:KXS10768.1 hypothetical protein M427DRAFT_61501 [Gonapodya prolifera JEL478]